jgi:hypothetical protein
MQLVFIESAGFTQTISDYFEDDEAYQNFQQALLRNPMAGAVMKGCGGMRKIRWKDPSRGKGKRSGLRVLYLHLPEFETLALLDIYDKDEKEDLTTFQRLYLTQIADSVKNDLRKRRKRLS